MYSKKYKNLFILGAAKSGTTFLYDQLKDHPQIVSAYSNKLEFNLDKEPDLLLKNEMSRERYIQAFLKNAKKKPEGNILIDASTNYTKWPHMFISPSDIEKIAKDYLCIYIFRDPIDRFESHINYNSYRRSMLERSLEEILNTRDGVQYLNIGNYAMQLFEYKEIFKKGKLLIIDFNDLITNTKKVLELVCSNINIEAEYFSEPTRNIISNKTPYKVLNNPRIIDMHPILRKALHKLLPQDRFRKNLSLSYHKFFNSKGYEKRLLSDLEKYSLAKIYKPSLLRLKEDFGINFYKTSWLTTQKYLS